MGLRSHFAFFDFVGFFIVLSFPHTRARQEEALHSLQQEKRKAGMWAVGPSRSC